MDKKIDIDLFTRLMKIQSSARKDLLEYMGQGPVSLPPRLMLQHVVGVNDATEVAEACADS